MKSPRKSPERFGPVGTVDLERLKKLVDGELGGMLEPSLPPYQPILQAIDKLILRSQIDDADRRRKRRRRAELERLEQSDLRRIGKPGEDPDDPLGLERAVRPDPRD